MLYLSLHCDRQECLSTEILCQWFYLITLLVGLLPLFQLVNSVLRLKIVAAITFSATAGSSWGSVAGSNNFNYMNHNSTLLAVSQLYWWCDNSFSFHLPDNPSVLSLHAVTEHVIDWTQGGSVIDGQHPQDESRFQQAALLLTNRLARICGIILRQELSND